MWSKRVDLFQISVFQLSSFQCIVLQWDFVKLDHPMKHQLEPPHLFWVGGPFWKLCIGISYKKNKHELCWNYLHFLHLLFFFLVAVWGEFICIRGPIGVGVIVSGQTNAPSFVPKNSIHEPRKTEKWRKRLILLGQKFPWDMFPRI